MPVLIAAALLAVGTAHAEELVAIRPGVMCRSAEALARLTLHGGDSRTHAVSPRPRDLHEAATGGCIDILPGARVTVRQAFHNTSIVTTGTADAFPMVVPNIDFRSAGAMKASMTAPAPGMAPGPPGSGPAPPPGYAVLQRLAVGGPGSPVLVLLADRRLTPAVRDQIWGSSGDLGAQLDPHSPLSAHLTHSPLLAARLQLLSADGRLLAETREKDYAVAKVELAPIHGLPLPTFLYTVDISADSAGFSGSATVVLTPTTRALAPVEVVPDRGSEPGTLSFMSTLHARWAIVPARHGGPEEIEDATCYRDTPDGRLLLTTYHFRDGQWHSTERSAGPCRDVEVMPRNAFP